MATRPTQKIDQAIKLLGEAVAKGEVTAEVAQAAFDRAAKVLSVNGIKFQMEIDATNTPNQA